MEISDEIKKLVWEELDNHADSIRKRKWKILSGWLPECGSPIEQKLLVYLWLDVDKPSCMWIAPQVEIRHPDPSRPGFRVDFLIYVEIPNPPTPPNVPLYVPLFAVECDGRDYHESHAQIERDKQRDRKLAMAGLPILRLTGSEINRNPEKCAAEVKDCFERRLRDILISVCEDRLELPGEPIFCEWEW